MAHGAQQLANKADARGKPGADTNSARLGGRYDIIFDKPLDFLSTSGADAYVAVDLLDRSHYVYGLLHKSLVPGRAEVAKSLIATPISNLINPIEQDAVRFDLGGRTVRRLITIAEFPKGGPLFHNGSPTVSFSSDAARKCVLHSAIRALTGMHGRGMPHRAIRPENLFFADDGHEEIIFGDCFSAPPGADQPAVFEPLERAFADPFARGDAGLEADMFALGATLMSLYIGGHVGHGREPDKLLHARVNQGSFWALSGGRAIPGNVNSLLRGLLNDDPNERWSIPDLTHWLNGGLPARRIGMDDHALSRPVSFMGVTYSDRRLLADAFADNPRQAADFLHECDFHSWIQRVISKDVYSERTEELVNVGSRSDLSARRSADAAMVARVCTHIDPTGPIRFRSLRLYLDGLGAAMADAFRTGDQDRLNAFRDLIGTELMMTLLRIMGDRNPQANKLNQNFKDLQRELKDERPGFGLERILYKFNPNLPCNSSKLELEWPDSVGSMLRALDRHTDPNGGLQGLMDQHIFAFAAAHHAGLDSDFGRISNARKNDKFLAPTLAEFYARLQQSSGVERLQRLTAVLIHNYRPIVERLRSRTRKKLAAQRLEDMSGEGNIVELVRSLDLRHIAQLDQQEFARARRRLVMLDAERARLSERITPVMAKPRHYGYRVAIATGYIVLVATIIVFSLLGI